MMPDEQAPGRIPDELLVQVERLDMVGRKHVRRRMRFRCRMLVEEAFLLWYAELHGAIARGDVSPEDMMRWRPQGLLARLEKEVERERLVELREGERGHG